MKSMTSLDAESSRWEKAIQEICYALDYMYTFVINYPEQNEALTMDKHIWQDLGEILVRSREMHTNLTGIKDLF